MVRQILYCALAISLSSTVSIAQSDEWSLIDAEKSYLVAPGFDASGAPLQRLTSQGERGSLLEFWRWPSGSMFLTVPPENFGFAKKKRNHLVENMHNWDFLKTINLAATKNNVERSKNRFGVYYYLVSTDNNAELTCFVFIQNLPVQLSPGYQESGDRAGGFLEGFDCRPSYEQPVANYGQMIADVIGSIGRNKSR